MAKKIGMIVLGLILTFALVFGGWGCAKEAPAPAPTPAPKPAPKPAPPEPKEDAAAFYKGKTMQIIVPSTPGGGYDLDARVLAQFFEKYTGATVIVQNKAGAGGVIAMNYVYKTAKRDGLTLCNPVGGGPYVAQILSLEGVNYNNLEMSWIGRFRLDAYVLCTATDSAFKSIQDVIAAPVYRAVGTQIHSAAGLSTIAMAEAFGLTNVKMILGYPGSAEQRLSVMTHEGDAVFLTLTAQMPYIEAGKFQPLLILAPERDAQIPDTPTAVEIGIKPEGKKAYELITGIYDIGRALITTPGVSAARLQFLRETFMKIMKDEEYIKRAKQLKYTLAPQPGEETEALVKRVLDLSPEEMESFKQLVEKYR